MKPTTLQRAPKSYCNVIARQYNTDCRNFCSRPSSSVSSFFLSSYSSQAFCKSLQPSGNSSHVHFMIFATYILNNGRSLNAADTRVTTRRVAIVNRLSTDRRVGSLPHLVRPPPRAPYRRVDVFHVIVNSSVSVAGCIRHECQASSPFNGTIFLHTCCSTQTKCYTCQS